MMGGMQKKAKILDELGEFIEEQMGEDDEGDMGTGGGELQVAVATTPPGGGDNMGDKMGDNMGVCPHCQRPY